ncbi:MAG: 2OG-Fe(II) oxygenase [Acidobacteriota bacterium]
MEDTQLESVLDGLAGPGFVTLPTAWPLGDVDALRREALEGWQDGSFHQAGVGRGGGQEIRSEVRRDLVRWLDPEAPSEAASRWWQWLEALRTELNRHLFLGLVEAEAHLAVYPAGAFYRRHLDRFRDDDARTISCLLYLNDAWSAEDGGILRLYAPEDGRAVDVLPAGGTIVLFRSDTVEHEVLAAGRPRVSLACWLRRRS